jgi:hypothetical protein
MAVSEADMVQIVVDLCPPARVGASRKGLPPSLGGFLIHPFRQLVEPIQIEADVGPRIGGGALILVLLLTLTTRGCG